LSIAAGVVPQSSCSLSPIAPAATCSRSASGRLALPLPVKPRFIGNASAACSMRSMCHGPGVQVVAEVPVAGPVPPPIIVVMPEASASSICCGQMKWMWVSIAPAVTIMPSPAIASVPGPMMIVTPGLDVRVAGLADAGDAPVLDPDVALDHAPVVEHERVGDDRVDGLARGALRLAHPVADHLAAAELDLLAVGREVALDLDPQFRVGEAQPVARRRAEHLRVGAASEARGHRQFPERPADEAVEAVTMRSPASATSVTVRVCPGSKRTAVPAAMSRRKPRARARSKSSASLVSKKW
jgi:hypothetical protein